MGQQTTEEKSVAFKIANKRPGFDEEQIKAFSMNTLRQAKSLRQKMSKATKIKLKVLFSLIMFGSLFIFGKVDLSKSWQAALNANRLILLITTLLFLTTVVITAVRWKLLAKAVGFHKNIWELTKYCFVGLFFNLFLPSTVGGDFSRCYYLSKDTKNYKDAFYSVLADRASGIAVLFITATLGILLSPDARSLPLQLKIPIFLGTFAVFVVVPFMPVLSQLILGKTNWISRQFNESKANIFWQDKSIIVMSLFWSLFSQLLMVMCHIGVGLALGLNQIPLWYYFVFYPAVAVLGFITPSFNGIGIREWAYTYFLMLVNVDRSHAITYALMWFGLTTFSSLVGGIVYLASHMKPPPKEADPDALNT